MAIRDGQTLICTDCGEEFIWRRTKPGLVNQCRDCGDDTEKAKGNTRPGGVIEYECKTNGVMKVVSSLESAKRIKHLTNRHGQGRPVGMAKLAKS